MNTNSGRFSSLRSRSFHPKQPPRYGEDESGLLCPAPPLSQGSEEAASSRWRPSSNTSVVRAPGYNGSSFPLHSEEGDSSKKPKYHHDQELPMKEKVVTVEKCHSCANGLRIKKTRQIMKHAQVTQPTPQRTPPLWPKASCHCSLLLLHLEGTSLVGSSQTRTTKSRWELGIIK